MIARDDLTSHTADPVRGVSIPMRDGVLLSTDIYGAGAQPRPVIFERTPYGRQSADPSERIGGQQAAPPREAVAWHYVKAGFAYVVQDCRGTGEAGGRFDKYVQEAADGEDALDYILAAPWCDGRVAMVGHSYGAACQVSLAARDTGQLAAIVADCGGFSNAFTSGIRQGGAFDQKQAVWVVNQTIVELLRTGDIAEAERLRALSIHDWLLRGPWVAGKTPLGGTAPARQTSLSSFWQAGEESVFWRRDGLFVDHAQGALRRLPGLYISSWCDTSLRATIENFTSARDPGDPGAALVIGTWRHTERHVTRSGDADFGRAALPENGLGASLIALRTAWIADRLAGRPLDVPVVRYFEMGGGTGAQRPDGSIDHSGRWRSADSWPPAGCTSLVLACDGGRLSGSPPRADAERSFMSDPDHPVPTCGGAINSGAPVMQGGVFDQNALFPFEWSTGGDEMRPRRDDMLMLVSAPLENDLFLCGEVAAELFVSSVVPDADVAIKLIDCYPDGGPCLNLTDGILRLRYREGFAVPLPLPPLTPVRARIEAYPIAARIKAGHRLRLDIAGANFPHFDINPQTGGKQGMPGPRRAARITVHSGPSWPARLVLTVRSDAP